MIAGAPIKTPSIHRAQERMTTERTRWKEAITAETIHGGKTWHWIAASVRDLALAGDVDGVERMLGLAVRYDQLQRAGVHRGSPDLTFTPASARHLS